MIEVDWEERTQLVWVSPLLPKLPENSEIAATLNTDEENFRSDLIQYIDAYTQRKQTLKCFYLLKCML